MTCFIKHSDGSGLIFHFLRGHTNILTLSVTLFPSTDEVAAFLLYVKTLGYQDKPDYQRLKAVLATSVMGRLDFSAPQGPTGVSTTKVQDQPTREKVRTWWKTEVYVKMSELWNSFRRTEFTHTSCSLWSLCLSTTNFIIVLLIENFSVVRTTERV